MYPEIRRLSDEHGLEILYAFPSPARQRFDAVLVGLTYGVLRIKACAGRVIREHDVARLALVKIALHLGKTPLPVGAVKEHQGVVRLLSHLGEERSAQRLQPPPPEVLLLFPGPCRVEHERAFDPALEAIRHKSHDPPLALRIEPPSPLSRIFQIAVLSDRLESGASDPGPCPARAYAIPATVDPERVGDIGVKHRLDLICRPVALLLDIICGEKARARLAWGAVGPIDGEKNILKVEVVQLGQHRGGGHQSHFATISHGTQHRLRRRQELHVLESGQGAFLLGVDKLDKGESFRVYGQVVAAEQAVLRLVPLFVGLPLRHQLDGRAYPVGIREVQLGHDRADGLLERLSAHARVVATVYKLVQVFPHPKQAAEGQQHGPPQPLQYRLDLRQLAGPSARVDDPVLAVPHVPPHGKAFELPVDPDRGRDPVGEELGPFGTRYVRQFKVRRQPVLLIERRRLPAG